MTIQKLLQLAELIKPENFVSVRELQKSPSKTLSGGDMKIILSNGKPLGLFLSIKKFEQLKEDLELLNDKEYLKDIEEARAEKELIPADKVWEKAGLI